MDATASISIRGRAMALWAEAWERRDVRWPQCENDVERFLVHAPEAIATGILGFKVDHVPEFPQAIEQMSKGKALVEIAGQLDRKNRMIIVAQKWGPNAERYTLVHEIGHLVLHKEMVLHRERAWNGRPGARRTTQELETDVFGAELLMPSHLVRAHVLARFKGPITGRDGDEAVLYWLSKDGKRIDREKFFGRDRRYRALQLATARRFHEPFSKSLCEFFRVSPSAMAIQIEDLGWVT